MSLIVKRATTQEEIDAIHRLYYEVFCEELGMRNPGDYPDKKDIDDYVSCSTYFYAEEVDEIIGAIRLVSHKCTGKFLMEKTFQLPDFITTQRETALEVSRAVIKKTKRKTGDHLTLLALLKTLCEFSENNNYRYLCAFIIPAVLEVLLKIGWKFKWVGQSSKMYNAFFTPVVIELKKENINFKI